MIYKSGKLRGDLEWWQLRSRGLRLEVGHEITAVVRDTADGDIMEGWFKRSLCDLKQCMERDFMRVE